MSSLTHNKSQYQPLSCKETVEQQSYNNMDNPGLGVLVDDGDRSSVETRTSGLPSTYSSQQLMPSSESDSTEEVSRLANTRTSIGRSQWFTVGVLCFVNLINYMDRFTIAGKSSHFYEY